jgi:predicted anti-sigma-YlaC factor YlaD
MDTLATERYLLDEMSADERQTFEDHFFACEVCADDVRTAAAMVRGAKEGLAGVATSGRVVPMVLKPSAVRKAPWYRSVALPWAVAATLALATAYQSFLVVRRCSRNGAVALVPVTLVRRAAEPKPSSARSGRAVSLALEINDAAQGASSTSNSTVPMAGTSSPGACPRRPRGHRCSC